MDGSFTLKFECKIIVESDIVGGELLDFHETEEKPLALFYLIVFQAKIVSVRIFLQKCYCTLS